jgi:hypothetical protein
MKALGKPNNTGRQRTKRFPTKLVKGNAIVPIYVLEYYWTLKALMMKKRYCKGLKLKKPSYQSFN